MIKRDVLAGGKGVVVTTDFSEAEDFIEHSIGQDGKVLLEEFLPGEEASMLVVMDEVDLFVCRLAKTIKEPMMVILALMH